MTNEAMSAGVVGAVSAVGTALLQATGGGSSNMTLVVPLVSAVIGGVMSYAVLKTTVSKMERDVRDIRKDMGEMYALLREALTKIAHMEGRLDSQSH
jgi:hypothetical protein